MSYRLQPVLFLAFLVFAVAFLTGPVCLGQAVLISELMADNSGYLVDADGDSPDWIELYNTTDGPADLDGWFLTDNAANLTKWRFPATNMAAGGFLLVFASDKDRSVAGDELHTNFKLSAAGEYLALVRPDGVSVESEHTFADQQANVSYGHTFSGGDGIVPVDSGAACTAHIPSPSNNPRGWQWPGFNDTQWLHGVTGVGFERGSGYGNLIGLDVEAMYEQTKSVYIRVPFELADAGQVLGLRLKMKYDDGFIAYLNGTEVATVNFSGVPAWDSGADGHHSDSQAKIFQPIDVAEHLHALQDGTNVLAIHGMNATHTSPDLLFVPRLEVDLAGAVSSQSPGLLEKPTPGQANAAVRYEGAVGTMHASPQRGFYDAAVSVTLSNETPGAVIFYTLDGSEPTTNSTPYLGAITVNRTATLRSRAFMDEWKASPNRTDTYIFVDDVVRAPQSSDSVNGQVLKFGMDPEVVNNTYYDASNQVVTVQDALKAIPTISITTDDDNLYDPDTGIYVNATERWERPASVELIHPDGSEGFFINAGLRLRGGWSRHDSFPKHSFRLFFRSAYGASKLEYPLFEEEGVTSFDKIDLRTAQNYNWSPKNDTRNTFLRDVFCRDSAGAMGDDYTRSRYYHLYLNGLYWGLYMTEERPVADFGAAYHGGDAADFDAIKVIAWDQPGAYTIEATDGTLDAFARLFDAAMAGFTDNADYFAVQGRGPDGTPDPAYEKLLDRDNMIDYLLMIYYSGASDNCISKFRGDAGLNNLYALYHRADPDGFKWIQHDCEHALDTSTSLNRTGPFTSDNFKLFKHFNAQTLHEKLSENAEYRIAFADRVYKHFKNGGALVQTNCEARLDARAAQIDRAIVANAARWGSTSLDRDTWVRAVATTRSFFAGRCETVIGYLDDDGLIPSIDPPQLSLPGGLVEDGTAVGLSAVEGTIYFTTDGSDPRAIGGAPTGTPYAAPPTVTGPVHLKARARKADGEWSALSEGVFWTEDVPLAVTELMYHAPDGNQHDFIEVRNISDKTVTLKGYSIDQAIDYKFKQSAYPSLAPGEHLVAVKDIDVFSSAYVTNGLLIAGEYQDDFNNSGEKVHLEFKGENLITFTYSDARNWPQAADGGGHSLVPLEAAVAEEARGSLDYGGNWRASTYRGGSPGTADPAAAPTVLLNEITAHTDTGLPSPYDSNDRIELFNPTTSDAVLTGWYLSDDPGEPAKWPIPNGTVVPARGFVLFDEDDFHPARTHGFGLDKAGEQVMLSTADRIVDMIRFKGQENGAALGRYPDGETPWLATQPTPAAPNQPAAAAVRIQALMYHPLTPAGYARGDMLEYIQLTNQAAGTVWFENDAGPWRMDGGVSYTFPTGSALPAGDRLWLVCFDPVLDPNLLNLFCGTYGLTASQEIILGPYRGQLSNEGERVAVERPQASDDPLRPLDVSWVVVDEIYYFDRAPWPAHADGTGHPLTRTGTTTWGVPTPDDTDADQLPDAWEWKYFNSLDQAEQDWDRDRSCNRDEYICGTDPTNAASRFVIEGCRATVLNWTAVSGRVYSVYWTDDLRKPFVRIATRLAYPVDRYADEVQRSGRHHYYRIDVELE